MSLGLALRDRMYPPEVAGAADPVAWIETALGEHLWSKQVEIAESVRDHRYTAVQSAHGVGKTHIASRLIAHWIVTHPVGEAFAIGTAPSTPQVRAILFRALRQAHRRGKLPGTISNAQIPEWVIDGELVAYGRKPQDLTDPETAAAHFQGIHARSVLTVLDEAAGIEPWLWDAVDTLTTNERARVLAIGNPTDPSSRFAEVCKPGSGWNTIRVSAFDAPAFTGEHVSQDLAELLVGRTWVEERRKRWGEDSPLFVARVLGRFPKVAEDTLVAPSLVETAQVRDLSGAMVRDPGLFGVDVARTGTDQTVVYLNRGGVLRLAHRAHGHDTMRTAGEVAALMRRVSVPAAIDVIGVGAGVYDRLLEQDLPVLAFNSSNRAHRRDRFANRRAEAFWHLREAFQAGAIDLDPADDELAAQLGAIRWRVNSAGQILIESKDDMRKRGLPSPDRADAVAMAVETHRWGADAMSDADRPIDLSKCRLSYAGDIRAAQDKLLALDDDPMWLGRAF